MTKAHSSTVSKQADLLHGTRAELLAALDTSEEGLTPLSPLFFLYLLAATGTYLALVEVGKRVLMRRRAY